jgi:phosphatidate cytidylyltransferase
MIWGYFVLKNPEFYKRAAIAIIFAPLLIILPYIDLQYYAIFMGFLTLLSSYELFNMFKVKESRFFSILTSVIPLITFYQSLSFGLLYSLLLFIIFFIYTIFSERDLHNNIIPQLLSIIYVALFFTLSIPIAQSYGGEYIILIYITIWATDTFAYLGGVTYGKHKLCPKVSPKKSIEGAITGLVLSVVAVSIFSELNNLMSLFEIIVLGILLSISGQLGDLFESKLKRRCEVKDSSSLIPGHGGVLDRFDSFLFVTPTLYIILFILNIEF